jgi:hypothetical protein
MKIFNVGISSSHAGLMREGRLAAPKSDEGGGEGEPFVRRLNQPNLQ